MSSSGRRARAPARRGDARSKKKKAGAGGGSNNSAAAAASGGEGQPQTSSSSPFDETKVLRETYAEARLTDQVRQLRAQNELLSEELRTVSISLEEKLKKKRDIAWYLNREIKEKDEEIDQLGSEVQRLRTELASVKEEHEAVAAQLREATESKVSALEEDLSQVRERYDEVTKFVEQKDYLMGELEHYRRQLDEARAQHVAEVDELERRNVEEKNRLKKEMLRKVKETKLSLLAMTEDQLHTTTKRTIMENDQMTTELQYQSKVSEKLLRQVDDLTRDNKRLKRELELEQEQQQMLAARTNLFQKLIKKLNAKVRSLEARHAASDHSTTAHGRVAEAALAEKDAEIESLERAVAEAVGATGQLQARLADVTEERDRARQANEQLFSLQDEAVTFLLTCLEDVKKRFAIAAATGDELDAEGRERVLSALLDRLNRSGDRQLAFLQLQQDEVDVREGDEADDGSDL